jgi:hypothetical protein
MANDTRGVKASRGRALLTLLSHSDCLSYRPLQANTNTINKQQQQVLSVNKMSKPQNRLFRL